MSRWEYVTLTRDVNRNISDEANALGAGGWELVHVGVNDGICQYVFKRPAEVEPVEVPLVLPTDRFDPSAPACAKCGNRNVGTEYHAQNRCLYVLESTSESMTTAEHLHRRCNVCRYDWCDDIKPPAKPKLTHVVEDDVPRWYAAQVVERHLSPSEQDSIVQHVSTLLPGLAGIGAAGIIEAVIVEDALPGWIEPALVYPTTMWGPARGARTVPPALQEALVTTAAMLHWQQPTSDQVRELFDRLTLEDLDAPDEEQFH